MIRRALISGLLASVAHAAAAPVPCEREASAAAMNACLTRRLADVERQLAETVQRLQGETARRLPGAAGKEVIQSLRGAERQFADWRRTHCQWLADSVGETKSGQAWTHCFIRLTEQHTAELRRQLPAAAAPARKRGSP